MRGLTDEDLRTITRQYPPGNGWQIANPKVIRYDRSAPALLVLADYVVNTAFQAFKVFPPHRLASSNYASVLEILTGLRFVTTTPGGPVSHVALVEES
jgi:hypothetical protein